MRVLIATAGARGDVAPLTGLSTAIRAAGHSVTIASNDEYEALVVGSGLEFRALPGTHGMFDDLRWVERSGLAAGVGIVRLLAENVRTLRKAVLAVARRDAADVLALTGITAIGGYQVAEGLALPSMELQLMPTHTTTDFAPSIVTGRSFGRLGNRVVGMATTTALAAMAGPARGIRHELGLPRRGIREVFSGQPDTRRWPVFHGFSPAVVPRPADWPDGYEVTGYWWPRRLTAWSPPAELEKFLASGRGPQPGTGRGSPQRSGRPSARRCRATGRYAASGGGKPRRVRRGSGRRACTPACRGPGRDLGPRRRVGPRPRSAGASQPDAHRPAVAGAACPPPGGLMPRRASASR
jgi:sterol 3beta-glucosyltransferase